MALILEFPPPVVAQSPALARIRRLSRPLAWLFTGLFAVMAVLLATAILALLFYEGTRLQVRPGGMQIYVEAIVPPVRPGWSTLGSQPLIQRIAMIGSVTLMLGPALAVLWQLRRLFGLYASGVILAVANARCVFSIAVWLIAYAVGPTLGHMLVSAAGFDDRGWLRLDSFQALALGLILLVVARVMQWGAEVSDDASRFV